MEGYQEQLTFQIMSAPFSLRRLNNFETANYQISVSGFTPGVNDQSHACWEGREGGQIVDEVLWKSSFTKFIAGPLLYAITPVFDH